MLLAAETGGITRFSTPRKPVSMTGMRPAVCQSGDSLRRGRMKKLDASRKLDRIMIQAAGVAARHDDRLKAYYKHAKKRHGGSRAIAAAHVADKTVRYVWTMLRNDEPHRHRNEDLCQGKLARLDRAMYSDNVQRVKG